MLNNLMKRTLLSSKSGVKHVSMDALKPNIDNLLALEVNTPISDSNDIESKFLRVRLATEADLEGIVELERKGYDGYLAWGLSDFKRDWLRNRDAVYLLLEEVTSGRSNTKSNFAGMVIGRFVIGRSHISHLIVDPAWQSFGLGSYLLEIWLEMSKLLLKKEVTLEVRESNHVALNLYYKHHFVLQYQKPFYYDNNGETAYYLKCVL